MPSAPTQDVIDAAEPFFTAANIPVDLITAFWPALDAAGLTVVTKAAGDPAEVTDETVVERVRCPGLVGAFLIGVQVGTGGWLVCIEQTDKNGVTTRGAWQFKPGTGALLD